MVACWGDVSSVMAWFVRAGGLLYGCWWECIAMYIWCGCVVVNGKPCVG